MPGYGGGLSTLETFLGGKPEMLCLLGVKMGSVSFLRILQFFLLAFSMYWRRKFLKERQIEEDEEIKWCKYESINR